MSVGLGQKHLGLDANIMISLCNATGAGAAGYLGGSLQHYLPLYLAPLLAAGAFGTLAIQEFATFHRNLKSKLDLDDKVHHQHQPPQHLDTSRALQLALPMTLNNLAGGVAGGAVGVTPLQAALFAFLASFMTMFLGYEIGKHIAAATL
ncbi:hypothetical protein IV203_003737 [Nitzschia inconspicua]|uniref:Uncharacterized protein n=1 Tax=Nitzschia inconspicua TaxID=303405 RepID=A0A9K3L425_9STRA|nr:hypothetical protein IV203_003737 [Nitzschia inconspicua]